jgi:glycosyltransferase involved in cell wall biosynthesis
LLFAARLLREKGVDVLLDALAEIERRGESARVDVIGEGPRRAACEAAASALRSVELRVLDPVPYGRAFFEIVRARSAVLVPNLGDEQPRIVFDAYAQAVPVIAFDTDGLRPHVKHGETGLLVARGTTSLAGAIARASSRPADLARMGMLALAQAHRFTHRGMHEERSRILARALSAAPRRSTFSSSPRP